MRFFMSGERYEPIGAKARRVEDIVRRVEGLPGVQAVFASNLVPVSGGGASTDIEVEGRRAENQHPTIQFPAVTPQVLRTLDVRVRQGRDFTESDSTRSVAIINETMARRMWPQRESDRPAVQDLDRERTRASGSPSSASRLTCTCGESIPSNSQIPPLAFVPYSYGEFPNTGLTIRVSGDPTALVTAVRAAIRASDPNLPVFAVRTLEDVRQLEFWEYALYGWIFGTIGVIGVVLASIGVYGVLAYSVSQRTQEIGVRVTLGAGRSAGLQADRRAGTQAHRDRHRHRSGAGGVRHAADAQPALQREPVRSLQFRRRLAVFHRRGPGGQLRAGSTRRQRRPRRRIAPGLTRRV